MVAALVLAAFLAVAAAAFRYGRGSLLGKAAIAVALAGFIAYALIVLGGDLECRERRDCSDPFELLRAIVLGAVLVLPVLGLAALVRLGAGRLTERPGPDGGPDRERGLVAGRFERKDRWWLISGFVLLLLTPLVILGAAGSRVAATVVMGTCVVMAFAPPLAAAYGRRTGEPIERGTFTLHGGARPATLFRFSAGRQLGLGVSSFGFTVLGVCIAIGALEWDGEQTSLFMRVIGVVCAVMGLVFGTLNIRQGRGEQVVALLDEGLAHRSWMGDAFLPWDAITDVWVTSIRGAEFLSFGATAPERFETPQPHGLLAPLNRRISGGDYDIPVVTLRADPDELLGEIGRRLPT